ncbi:MAG: rod shape-determining protein [Actinomycetota bacterium]|nr:rod shape-determining protein [Actinomycetota bacterium]
MGKGSRLSKSIALDLGSSNLYWCDAQSEEVVAEANIALVDDKKRRIVEVGDAAASALGRAEGHHHVVRPIRNGRIEDVSMAERYFSMIFSKMGFGRLRKPDLAVVAPIFCTAAEKRVLASAMMKAGAGSVIFVDALVAAAVGALLDFQGPRGSMVASVGAQTTFAGVMGLGESLTSSWELVGGDTVSNSISTYLRSSYNIVLVDSDLEELKLSLLDLSDPHLELSARVVGRDAETGGEAEATISAREIYDASAESAKLIVETILSALTTAPPEISNDLVETGLTLVGRASLTTGLDVVVGQACAIPVARSVVVETASVIGAARILNQVPAGN